MTGTTENSPSLLIDAKAAALFVGIGEGVLRGWVACGLPFVRAGRGGKKMFARRDLEKWVERVKEVAA
jgi:hypothetical protein